MPLTGEYVPSPDQRSRDQVELFEATDGAEGNTIFGLPVIVLTTKGARSGNLRKIPLMRVEHEGDYAVVASMGGAPKHPVWYFNLITHPDAELQDGNVKRDYTARELSGDERTQWWDRAVAAYPPYAEYQTRTDRQIPVFVLEPAA